MKMAVLRADFKKNYYFQTSWEKVSTPLTIASRSNFFKGSKSLIPE